MKVKFAKQLASITATAMVLCGCGLHNRNPGPYGAGDSNTVSGNCELTAIGTGMPDRVAAAGNPGIPFDLVDDTRGVVSDQATADQIGDIFAQYGRPGGKLTFDWDGTPAAAGVAAACQGQP